MTPAGSLGALLARRVEPWAAEHGAGLVVGVCGPQGCGKTTACAKAAARLGDGGLVVAVLGLDDLYLPRAERDRLARDTHPLFRTRGPPGTHDVALGHRLIDAVKRGPVRRPVFDKARDDRAPETALLPGPADVVLLEGWCVGVRPQGPARLTEPLNALEREADADGRWRAAVDSQLAGSYAALWSALDRLVLLHAPGWDAVCGWRADAEAELRARTGHGMEPEELARFMAHYERLTRWAEEDLPARADVVVRLDAARAPVGG